MYWCAVKKLLIHSLSRAELIDSASEVTTLRRYTNLFIIIIIIIF